MSWSSFCLFMKNFRGSASFYSGVSKFLKSFKLLTSVSDPSDMVYAQLLKQGKDRSPCFSRWAEAELHDGFASFKRRMPSHGNLPVLSQFETHLSIGCIQHFKSSTVDSKCCRKPLTSFQPGFIHDLW